jgi:hypothetical protein
MRCYYWSTSMNIDSSFHSDIIEILLNNHHLPKNGKRRNEALLLIKSLRLCSKFGTWKNRNFLSYYGLLINTEQKQIETQSSVDICV